jgi:hypothetical protein
MLTQRMLPPVRAVAMLVVTLTMSLFMLGTHGALAQASGDKRVALVVGNSAYRSIPRLANPTNDARLIGDTLKALGFTLIGGRAQLDLDKGKFEAVLSDFGRQIRGADVALFFYAGHGIQLSGMNWLVPTSARPQTEGDVPVQMVDANTVLRYMDGAGARLNIVVLDACRNNPFAEDVSPGRTAGLSEPQPQGSGGRVASLKGIRSSGGGLGRMQAPTGTLIAYATQPGNVALDGTTGNSPFSAALASTMRKPGLDVFKAFNEVGLQVASATGNRQQPWVSASPLSGEFFFAGRPAMNASTLSGDRRRFDGQWRTVYVCEAMPDGVRGYSWSFMSEIKEGSIHGKMVAPKTKNTITFSGNINSDGSAVINGEGRVGTANLAIDRAPEGTPVNMQIKAQFNETTGTGKREGRRVCSISYTRQ